MTENIVEFRQSKAFKDNEYLVLKDRVSSIMLLRNKTEEIRRVLLTIGYVVQNSPLAERPLMSLAIHHIDGDKAKFISDILPGIVKDNGLIELTDEDGDIVYLKPENFCRLDTEEQYLSTNHGGYSLSEESFKFVKATYFI